MDMLFIHALLGVAVFPIALGYWSLYWHVQSIDPHSLKLGIDVVTGEILPLKARIIKFCGFLGAVLLTLIWCYFGSFWAKGTVFYIDLLELFDWPESKFHEYLYGWSLGVVGLVSLGWYTAKQLIAPRKWRDDPRRNH